MIATNTTKWSIFVLKLLDSEVKKQKGTGVAVNRLDLEVRLYFKERKL